MAIKKEPTLTASMRRLAWKTCIALALANAFSVHTTAIAAPEKAVPFPMFISGNDLYRMCTGSGSKAWCDGYVAGSLDMIYLYVADRNGRQCYTPNFQLQQAVDIVVNRLRDYPEERNKPAAIIVRTALSNALC